MAMSREFKVYIAALVLLFLGFLLVEWSRPSSLDWSISYSKEHERPFGCRILYEELGTLFPEQGINSGKKSLVRQEMNGELEGSSMIFISEDFNPEEGDLELLFSKVRSGSEVFIAARSFSPALLDSIHVGMTPSFNWQHIAQDEEEEPADDTVRLDLEGVNTPEEGYPFSKGLANSYFTSYNPINSEAIGNDQDGNDNFLRVEWGDGVFYLHSNPLAFTNFYLSQEASYPYAFKALSHLSVNEVYWDERYKPIHREESRQTPMSFLLKNPPLRSALWVALLGLVLLLSFGAKRSQRPMPVIHPPRNASLSFVRTLGRLYYEDGGHAGIARMRVEQFLQRLEERTGVKIRDAGDPELHERIARRTGVSKERVREFMEGSQESLERKTKMNGKELLELDRRIREFQEEAGMK